MLDSTHEASLRLHVVRHAATSLSDGTFLGRIRDPSVADIHNIRPLTGSWDFVHSSPLRRAVDTARALAPGLPVCVDERLTEIDYGQAEGLTATDVRGRFPELADAWDKGEDPPFPQGEGTAEVRRRLHAYLDALPPGPGTGLVVTHNVVIRVLVADVLGWPSERAYRLPIAHLEPLTVCRIGDRWLPDWSPDLRASLIDGFVRWNAN